jgi:2-aminomuconate deaminase
MPRTEEFVSPRGPDPVGAYPHARRVGELLFVSGIGPRRKGVAGIPGVTLDGAGAVVSYDIEAQCLAVFENIRVILEDAGSRWENIVDVTSFLTDMKRDFAAYNKLYEKHFGHVRPTRTTVEVRALPTLINVELKVIAMIG